MAEGIKISEMEQVTTLQEGCCFPVISNGENKKITQKNLYDIMTKQLYNDKVNFFKTTMKKLGFSGEIELSNLWKKLYSTYGGNGVIEFLWDDAQKAIITSTHNTNSVYGSGGLLIYNCSEYKEWGYFNAIWVGTFSNKMYKLDATVSNETLTSKIYTILHNEDFSNLQNQITSNDDDISKLQNNKTNFFKTTMKKLGFSGTVDGVDFWKKLYSTYGENAVINFDWIGAEAANVKIEGSTFTISGGLLIYNCSSFKNYGYFSGVYIGGSEYKKHYTFTIYVDGESNTHENLNKLVNIRDISDLQSQINAIKKPDGIEIFRIGVNIPESSFTEQSSGAGVPPKEYKYTLPKTNARLIDYKLTSECSCRDNENGTVTIYMPTSMSGATNRICKGYIEYVEV